MRNHDRFTIAGIFCFIAAAILFSHLIEISSPTGHTVKIFSVCSDNNFCDLFEDESCIDCKNNCTDGYKNHNETGPDCGIICGSPCTIENCSMIANETFKDICFYESAIQRDNKTFCNHISIELLRQECLELFGNCTDGIKNQDETDIDCGGACQKCNLGKECIVNNDCIFNLCINNLCSCNQNNICESEHNENSTNCPHDCGCNNNGICEPNRNETRTNCLDCTICDNNGICEYWEHNENFINCPDDCKDKTGPKILDIELINIIHNSTELKFKTNEDANCTVKYGHLTQQYEYSKNIDLIKNIGIIIKLEPLNSNTNYFYRIYCNDTYQNENISIEYSFKTSMPPVPDYFPKTTKYNSTNFWQNKDNIDCIYNPWFEDINFGKIQFLDECVNLSYSNIDSYLTMRNGLIIIDSVNLPKLNDTARITMYNISLNNPKILLNNILNNSQYIESEVYDPQTKIFSFTAKKIGRFETKEHIIFEIGDLSNEKEIRINETNTFYARYLKLGQQVYDSGVNCTIEFADENKINIMEFDYYNIRYRYYQKFQKEGNYSYKITCDGTPVNYLIETRQSIAQISNNTPCGDGKCIAEQNENCSTCPIDCGLCSADWECTEWPECINGTISRKCTLPQGTKAKTEKPIEIKSCTVPISILCSNKKLDQGEVFIDCGGPCTPCPTCSDGKKNCHPQLDGSEKCETGIDCGGPCSPCPTCSDGIKNQDEEKIDCGGPNCDPCPTCNDRIKNCHRQIDGSTLCEEDVDCGGPCPSCKDPFIEEPRENPDFMTYIIIFFGILILILGGAGAVITFKPEILHKFGAPEYNNQKKESKEPSQEIIKNKEREEEEKRIKEKEIEVKKYIFQNLSSGFQPAHIKNQLISQGIEEELINSSMQYAQQQIYESQINQLAQILIKENLRRPDRVYSKLLKQRCHPYVAKTAIERATQMQIQMGIR